MNIKTNNTNTNKTARGDRAYVNFIQMREGSNLAGYATVVVNGIRMRGIQIRVRDDGNTYIMFPAAKRLDKQGNPAKDKEGREIYDPYYNPSTKELRDYIEALIDAEGCRQSGDEIPPVPEGYTPTGRDNAYVRTVEQRPDSNLFGYADVYYKDVCFKGVRLRVSKAGELYPGFQGEKRSNPDGTDAHDDRGFTIWDDWACPVTREDRAAIMALIEAEVAKVL